MALIYLNLRLYCTPVISLIMMVFSLLSDHLPVPSHDGDFEREVVTQHGRFPTHRLSCYPCRRNPTQPTRLGAADSRKQQGVTAVKSFFVVLSSLDFSMLCQ